MRSTRAGPGPTLEIPEKFPRPPEASRGNYYIDIYGNTGGSKSSTEYTIPIRNADGMYLDASDNELYVILRYAGNPTPVTSITLTFS